MERPLAELRARVESLLAGVSKELRQAVIETARRCSASAAVVEGERLAVTFGVADGSRRFAVGKATRWLAMILRHHGEAVFGESAAILLGHKPGGRTAASPRDLGRLASGELVQDREQSHLHDGVRALLPRVLSHTRSSGREMIIREFWFETSVGNSTCVSTRDEDEIVYARREGREGLTRFVKNRQPMPCRCVTVILRRRCDSGAYEVMTAYIGQRAPREPCPKAGSEAFEFWSTHALVWGSEPVVEGTETSTCPW